MHLKKKKILFVNICVDHMNSYTHLPTLRVSPVVNLFWVSHKVKI